MFSDIELMAFELHQSKRNWLFLGIYKPPSQNELAIFRNLQATFPKGY